MSVGGIGQPLVGFHTGPRWWAFIPDTAPDWGLRLNAMLLFPK